LYQELEGVPSLKDAESLCGQQPGCKEFPVLGLVAETDLSPLDCRPDTLFSGVVCWFDSFVFQKGEQTMPVLQQALARLADIVIRALSILLEALVHSSLDGNRFQDKGLPVQMSGLEGVPKREHSSRLGKHPRGKSHGLRVSAGVLDSLDPTDDVASAELSDAVVELLVRRVHVRD
jgi:hypothetical protein